MNERILNVWGNDSSLTQNYTYMNCTNCSYITTTLAAAIQPPLSPPLERLFYFLYVCAIILGTSGNIISLIVFTNGRRCNTDIRGFLINLAVADLIMALVCLPFSFTSALTQNWIFSSPMCPIILFTEMLSVTVSVYTNTAISIDRFLAIKFPLKILRTSRRHVVWTIVVIWFVSAGLCSVQFATSKVTERDDGTAVCKEDWPNKGFNFRQLYTVIVLIITYVIPVVFIMTMYGLVCFQLWQRVTPGIGDQTRDTRQLKCKKKVRVFSINFQNFLHSPSI